MAHAARRAARSVGVRVGVLNEGDVASSTGGGRGATPSDREPRRAPARAEAPVEREPCTATRGVAAGSGPRRRISLETLRTPEAYSLH